MKRLDFNANAYLIVLAWIGLITCFYVFNRIMLLAWDKANPPTPRSYLDEEHKVILPDKYKDTANETSGISSPSSA